jgi:hypothetical protein
MKFTVVLAVALLFLSACASEPAPEPAPAEATMPAADAGADPLSGTWTGDWGPSAEHRNPVTLELAWDGASLTGTVNPGPNAIALATASFDPATSSVTMEADAENFRGEAVHYMIEGQVEGNMMSGTWTHDDQEGTFSLTMS